MSETPEVYWTQEKDILLDHKNNMHERMFENESEADESDEEICPTYQCDLCGYTAMYPDNVALHYIDVHNTRMSLEDGNFFCEK